MNENEIKKHLPLTEPAQVILAVLSGRKLHGYKIMKHAQQETGLDIPTGTLYRNISKMLKSGMIIETTPPTNTNSDDQRRKYYKLTGLGERILDAQIVRNTAIASAATQPRL